MLRYDDVEQLVADMFHTLEVDEDIVSVVADKDLTVEIMQELFTYENISLEYCDITVKEDYDREYFCSLSYDYDTEGYYFCIEPAYNVEKGKYLGTNGYVLFHEDVNSKVLTDMQNNEMSFLTGHDFFVIGEDDSFVNNDEGAVEETGEDSTKVSTSSDVKAEFPKTVATYRVNNKKVDKETYDAVLKAFKDHENKCLDMLRDSVFSFNRPRWMNEWMDFLNL